MKKMFRKAFTLVELLVVIAILAALATVGIVSFSAYTKKANNASDNTLLSQLNHHLVLMDETPNTYTEMKNYLSEFGIEIDKLSVDPKSNGCRYAWNIEENKLFLVNSNSEIIQPAEDAKTIEASEKHKYFVPVNSDTDVEVGGTYAGYSCYLRPNATISGALEVNAGVDTGDNAVSQIIYTNTGSTAKTVSIRTNSETTSLNINAPIDTIYHYEKVGIVNITRTANASYHERGIANYVQNASGRVVAENNGVIKTCILTAKGVDASLVAVAQEKGGIIEECYATTDAVANANNNENTANVRLTVLSVADNGNVLAEGKSAEQVKAVIENKKDEVAASANNSNYTNLTGEVRIGNTNYDKFENALTAVEDNQIIVFLKDVERNDNFVTKNSNITVIVDLANHTLKTTGATNGGRSIKIINGNYTVKNGTIDGRSYNGTNLNPNPSGSGPWSNTRAGGCIRVSGGEATLENLNMYNNDGWGNAVKVENKTSLLTMRNCSIESVYGDCIEVCEGKANIYDCQFRQSFTPNNSYMANCVAVSYLGEVNIWDSTMSKDEFGELTNGSQSSAGVCPLYVYDSGGVINVYGGYFKTSLTKVMEIDATNTNKYIVNKKDYTQEEYDAFVLKNGGSAIINVTDAKFEGSIQVNGSINGNNTQTTKLNVYSGEFSVDVTKYLVSK